MVRSPPFCRLTQTQHDRSQDHTVTKITVFILLFPLSFPVP